MTQNYGVKLTNVSKYYGDTVAVKDLSLEIEPGEFLFLLGPSGAGKSTLLRLIGGYEQPGSGTIEIGGRDVTGLPVEKRNIGMVFQSYALFPHMTVAQNVAFGLKMRRVGREETAERVAQALELVELNGLGTRYPAQLSGGQQQRVALARAVVYQPGILLLDEPLANLDRRLRDTMRVELKRLQRRIGITAIMVTHDQEESLSMADRIAVLHQGQLEQIGAPASVYSQPISPFVAAFISEINLFKGEVTAVKGARCRVKAAGLEFEVPAEANTHPEQQVTVCLRAERLRLDKTSTESTNEPGFTGKIEFITYLGASTLYLVRLDNSPLMLKVLEPNATGQPLYTSGETVQLGWSVESAICFFGAD